MRVSNQIIQRMKLAFSTLPTLTSNRLRNYYPKWFSSAALGIFCIILKMPGKYVSKLVPIRACAFVTSLALEFYDWEVAQPYMRKAKNFPESSKLIFNLELLHIRSESDSDFQSKLFDAVSRPPKLYNEFEAALSWGFWNLSHSRHVQLLERANETLGQLSQGLDDPTKRMLPHFTSNMGHLGYLTSYIGHYSVTDPNRSIILWPDPSPNKFFLDLVISQSPLKISTMRGVPRLSEIDIAQRDTLSQSKRADNSWRIELCAGSYSGENFFEVEMQQRFILKFPESSSDFCLEKLRSIGFNPNKWFVILHIRDSSGTFDKHGQARDGEIRNYIKFCATVNELGGQVIRMGHSGFSKLPSQMLAIDYAHSEIREDIIDCWLWSHCRWWTGTANGASLAAFAFGATRLITDQWFWDNIGPSQDFFMPKLASKSETFLSISETIHNELSREMGFYSKIPPAGLKLHGVPPDQLSLAAMELYENTQRKYLATATLSKLEIELAKTIRNRNHSQTMRIPTSYSRYMEETLSN